MNGYAVGTVPPRLFISKYNGAPFRLYPVAFGRGELGQWSDKVGGPVKPGRTGWQWLRRATRKDWAPYQSALCNTAWGREQPATHRGEMEAWCASPGGGVCHCNGTLPVMEKVVGQLVGWQRPKELV